METTDQDTGRKVIEVLLSRQNNLGQSSFRETILSISSKISWNALPPYWTRNQIVGHYEHDDKLTTNVGPCCLEMSCKRWQTAAKGKNGKHFFAWESQDFRQGEYFQGSFSSRLNRREKRSRLMSHQFPLTVFGTSCRCQVKKGNLGCPFGSQTLNFFVLDKKEMFATGQQLKSTIVLCKVV